MPSFNPVRYVIVHFLDPIQWRNLIGPLSVKETVEIGHSAT